MLGGESEIVPSPFEQKGTLYEVLSKIDRRNLHWSDGSVRLSKCCRRQISSRPHVAKGLPCTSCHVKDGSAELKIDDQKHEACVGCHGWYDAVSKRTQPKNPEEVNPHSQHDGNLPCTECHKGHKPGVNYCGECHMYTFKVP